MKAILYRRYGGPENLEFTDIAQPVPGPGQILIKVRCGSVNPIDWKLASGAFRLVRPVRFPATPGFDVAGEVAAVGAGVAGYPVGLRVHARIADGEGRGCAEYALAGVDVSAPMPESMDFAQAGGLPLAGMTALQGLRDECGMPLAGASGRVLIVGASGGVGHLALQIAKAAGAHTVGVCSSRNVDFVRGLGADSIIQYDQPNPYNGIEPFHIIYNCVSGDPGPWLPLLRPRGRYASCMPSPMTFVRALLNPVSSKRVRAVMLKPRAADLRILDELFEKGALRVTIDSRFPLADTAKAWARSQAGRAVGKIVIDVA
jgi:NADPH:quinone reductase-like Zn-dependent oxidoreductase